MSFDVIVVLGGGVREGGELPGWVRTRFDRALAEPGRLPILCLSAGTVHRPNPLDASGRPIFESVAGARYLLRQGVPSDRIFIEAASWDTFGNAYFTRTIHADPARWRRLLVITSESHMPRSRAIFEWVFALAPDQHYRLSFAATADEGLPPDLLRAREQREAASLESLPPLTRRIQTLAGLHRWLHTEHKAYAAALSGPEPAAGIVRDAY